MTKKHEIQTLNLRNEQKRKRHQELRKDFEDGKITWEYCYEQMSKLWVTKKSKTKKRESEDVQDTD